jgi:hypothetical protein
MNAKASSVRFLVGEGLLNADVRTIFGLRIDPMRRYDRCGLVVAKIDLQLDCNVLREDELIHADR